MKILLIHFSDMHIGSNNNSIFNKIEEMCQPIKKFCMEVDGIFLIITGDIDPTPVI